MEHRHQHQQESVFSHNQLDGLNDAGKDSEMANFCSICSMSFVEPSEFHSHMETNHGHDTQKAARFQINTGMTKQPTYECPECGKCYGITGHFLNHLRSHQQASKSVFHDLEHLKKKSFQCESCGRNYSRASALDAHRRCHEGNLVKSRNRGSGEASPPEEPEADAKLVKAPEKSFKCSCGKAFSAMMRLKTHQRFSRNSQCSKEEMKEKPKKITRPEFFCSECKKGFSSSIALFNHQRWHANHANNSAKRFVCEECGKEFMTQTFYYRHQRMVHSEAPAKSFLHQVCQLQKKAFECTDCGLKFSRASALQAHQLHHTEAFQETQKETQIRSPLQPHSTESESDEAEQEQHSESLLSSSMSEEYGYVNVEDMSDEDMDSYEPGDFNVQVISASESEDEPDQDVNPDLELVCESDQDVRDDDSDVTFSTGVSKPVLDLKIVQIDFDDPNLQCPPPQEEPETKPAEERFDCPECYRWFNSASSLRVHRMWHGIHKRRRQSKGQSEEVHTCDTCGHQTSSYAAHCSHIQQHQNENTSSDEVSQAKALEKKNLTCEQCGKCFARLSALVSHQLHHPKRKPFQCPDCMMSYSHATNLFNHMKNCSAQKKENISEAKKEYNPKKTLLGPKIYHCEHCGKGFWSLGAYSHHKQNPTECTDLRLRKGVGGSQQSVNGHQRSHTKVACPVCGRKFRHRGIMALHMRKHENGNHKCELCNRSFRLFSSLLRHQVVHSDQLLPPPIKSFQHQVEQLQKNTYSCPDCGKLFSRGKALQFHMKSHGYETGYSPSSPRSAVSLEDLQCATCLAHFSNKASLKAHRKLCVKRNPQAAGDGGDTVKLQAGSKGVATRHGIKAEVKDEDSEGPKTEPQTDVDSVVNTNNLKYKCNECEKSFSVVGALNSHKRIHAAKAKLSRSALLKKPKQEEQGKGLFHCSECGRRFMSNSALGSHKRWHKEKKFPRPLLKDDDARSVGQRTEGGPFQCSKCEKRFFNHRVLQRHQMFNPLCQIKNESDIAQTSLDVEFSSPGSKMSGHCETRQGDEPASMIGDQISRGADVNFNHIKSEPVILKPKAHQCPLCDMTFAKARGLHAHKWQVHSKMTSVKREVVMSTEQEFTGASGELGETEESPAVDQAAAVLSESHFDKGKKRMGSEQQPQQGSSEASPTDSKKVCKQETRSSETTAEVCPPQSRLSELTAKCLFKCDKCGKAFQTEELLASHKAKAKSRPFCCALCCHGFWTENQLQQHLAWHDEVRCRLPNEVRYRLSAALSANPPKPNTASPNVKTQPPPSAPNHAPLIPDGLAQSSHKCHQCGKAFLSPAALQKHKVQHCCKDSYQCSICLRSYSEVEDLISHHQECISDSQTAE